LRQILFMQTIQYIDRASGKTCSENPPAEGLIRWLYQTTLGRLSLQLLIKRKLITELYGRRMNHPRSKAKIPAFIEEFQIDMTEAQKSLEEFSSFNDFFYRKLKKGARPIQEGLVSPADGKLLAFESIQDIRKFYVKGEEFTLERFLKNKALAKQFKEASVFIIRLAPHDYHRFHFPYAGIPEASVPIKGVYYSVSPLAVIPNFAKVFCENKRNYVLLNTTDKGQMLISPVGAAMVGSIYQTFSPQKAVLKGDEMGYFAFGGSSILMLIPKDKVKIDADLLENTKNGMETAVKIGERIGI
jgi:phosphatidylserine decarboxylase